MFIGLVRLKIQQGCQHLSGDCVHIEFLGFTPPDSAEGSFNDGRSCRRCFGPQTLSFNGKNTSGFRGQNTVNIKLSFIAEVRS